MPVHRSQTILNSIAEYTAQSMSQSIYQNSLANMTLSGVNKGYNTVGRTLYARGVSKPIVCGQSVCGSEDHPTDEYCKYQ